MADFTKHLFASEAHRLKVVRLKLATICYSELYLRGITSSNHFPAFL